MEIAEIIVALGGLVGAIGGIYSIWTKYNQDAKNKRQSMKLRSYAPRIR
jgi:hypothetical protein